MNISVILCTYNGAHFIKRAIHSVLVQTYRSFELIVVDDGSTDNTKEVVQKFDDKRIRYVAHEKNKGLSAARNTGIALAVGQYIAFIDSDDEWEKDKLEKQMAFLSDKSTPVFVFSNALKIKQGHSAGHERELSLPTQQYDYNMYSVTAPSTWILSRNVFTLTGYFDEMLDRFEDIDFLFRMGQCHVAAYYLAEVVVKKFENDGNLSHVSLRTIKAREQFYIKHKKALRQESKYLFRLYVVMGKDALSLQSHSLARHYFLRALVFRPFRFDLGFKILWTFFK